MFIPNLLQFKQNQTLKQANARIKVKPFLDVFLDTAGWYTLGHVDRQQFLKAVIAQDKFPYAKLSLKQVQYSWAKFERNSFELVNQSTEDAQPITLIEDLGSLNQDDSDW